MNRKEYRRLRVEEKQRLPHRPLLEVSILQANEWRKMDSWPAYKKRLEANLQAGRIFHRETIIQAIKTGLRMKHSYF